MKTIQHLKSSLRSFFNERSVSFFTLTLAVIFSVAVSSARATTLAYWQFEPGNLSQDSSGNGHDLTVNNLTSSASIPTNAPGTGSLVLSGTSSYAKTVSNLDLSAFSGLTIECFVKTNGQSTLGMIYEHSASDSANNGGFYFDFNEAAGQVKVEQGAAPFAKQLTPYPTNDANWHHYAVTIDESGVNSKIDIYIDGVLRTNTTTTAAASRSFRNDVFNIGARNGSQFFFNGQLDELRISSRVLPPSGFLIAPALTGASIIVNQPPTNTTVLQGRPVTFSVGATLQNADQRLLDYQWRTNGVAVPGAIAPSFTIPSAGLEYQNVQVSVVLSVQSVGGVTPVTSTPATLTIQSDVNPPVALSAYAHANTMLSVFFDEVVNAASATNISSYALDSGVAVQSAQLLADGRTVVLTVSPLPNPTHTLSYGVADPYGNVASSTITVTNEGFISENINGGSTTIISTNSSIFTVTGKWGDIWSTNDNFNFIYKSFTGDFDVRLRVNSVGGTGSTSIRGGLMAREDNSVGARNVFMATYLPANNNWVSTFRGTNDGLTVVNKGAVISRGTGFSFPNAWVRISRVGQTFAAYYSTNNIDWVQYGTNVVASPAYPDTILVGIASETVSTNNTGTFQYSEFTKFSLTNGNVLITSQPTNTTVESFHTATFSVGATLQGSSDQSLLHYQWLSNGIAVDGANGSTFTIVQAPLNLSGTQVRCLVSAPGVAPVASASATLTVVQDTTAPKVISAYSPDSLNILVDFDDYLDPNTANNPSLYTLDGGFSVYNAQVQADGRSVLLTADGLNSPTFQVTISGVTDLSGNPCNTSISGKSAGALIDINDGFLIPSQIVAASSNGFTVNAAGRDIFGTADSFNFVYQPFTNDFDVSVRFIGSSPLRSGAQRGGLMVRQDFSQGSPNVFVGTYLPGGSYNNWVMTERATQDATTIINAFVAREEGFAFPNAWLRLKRSGQTISGYESTNGITWVQLSTNITDMTLPEVVYVGMASATISTLPAEFQYSDFGPVALVPQLQIQRNGGTVTLRWPTGANGFTLQQSTTLSIGSWGTVSTAPSQSGDYNEVTVPVSGSTTFFRLVR